MINRRISHTGYYISLVLLLVLGATFVLLVSPNKNLQLIFSLITVFLYIGWGMIHHFLNHELTPKIVVEYVLIGSLGLSAIFFLLKGGFGI